MQPHVNRHGWPRQAAYDSSAKEEIVMLSFQVIPPRSFNRVVLWVLVLLVVAITAAQVQAAELPKQFSFSHTLIATVRADHWTEVEFGDHGKAWTGHWSQVALDEGEGFRHNTSGHCIGMGYHTPQGGLEGSGFCYSIDEDGDQVFERWEFTGEGVGKGTYFGGTGKYAGIKCQHQFKRIARPTPSVKGIFQVIAKETGTCTQP